MKRDASHRFRAGDAGGGREAAASPVHLHVHHLHLVVFNRLGSGPHNPQTG